MAQNDSSSVRLTITSEGSNSEAMASRISFSTRSLRAWADRVSLTRKLICSRLSCHSQMALITWQVRRISASMISNR